MIYHIANPGEPIEIVNPDTGEVVRKSKNLRGILDHARRVGVKDAQAFYDHGTVTKGGGLLRVEFGDGNMVYAAFADYAVLNRWLKARRSWGDVRHYYGEE
jgi:hypothetical protein